MTYSVQLSECFSCTSELLWDGLVPRPELGLGGGRVDSRDLSKVGLWDVSEEKVKVWQIVHQSSTSPGVAERVEPSV